jgi:hypothetical protein
MLREKSMMTTKRRKTMSTKSTQIRKAHPVVNDVFFGLTDEGAILKAVHEKGEDKQIIIANASGSISTQVAKRGLRFIISYLEKKGLPVEPTDEWVPMDR